MKTKTIQSIKGFKDILPEVKYYKYVETIVSEVAHQYAINELRLPLVKSLSCSLRLLVIPPIL